MTSGGSFTGRVGRRKAALGVRIGDRVAATTILVGGVGTIVAVLLVGVFLAVVAAPLLLPSRVDEAALLPPLPGGDRLLRVGVDDQAFVAWTLAADGTLSTVSLDAATRGQTLATSRPLGDAAPTAIAFLPNATQVACGFADGSVRMGRIGVERSFLAEDTLGAAERQLAPGARRPFRDGLLERTLDGSFRLHRVAATFEPPIPPLAASPIRLLDFTERTSGPILVTFSDDQKLRVVSTRRVRNLLTGQDTVRAQQIELPFAAHGPERPAFLFVNGVGDQVLLAWGDGWLERFQIGDLAKPSLAESLDLVEEAGQQLTAATMLAGKSTLVAGDSAGRVRGWFYVRRPDARATDGLQLLPVHELAPGAATVRSLHAAPNNRTLLVGHADGDVRLCCVTTRAELLRVRAAADTKAVTMTPAAGGVVAAAVGPAGGNLWRIHAPHPDVTLASLFLPVWYEGLSGPAWLWQSTGADDVEPKLSLVPLVFGTLKATFYALLIGVPLALLAAIYTSEFLSPAVKGFIKPSIELMAGLPSVVLGFLAALVLAPFVERLVPQVLSLMITVPLSYLTSAFAWQVLPREWRLRLDGWRFAAICGVTFVIPLGMLGAWLIGPPLERFLFGGNIMAWLDGQADPVTRQPMPATGGLFFLLLPLVACGGAAAIWWWVSPVLRKRSRDWSLFGQAGLDFVVHLASVAAVLVGTWALAALGDALGFDPRGTLVGTYVQRNAMIVGFVMGFAVIPIIFTIAEDALSAVPSHLRAASLGAGATRWQTAVRIVVPTAMSGLFSAVMIGMGRAVGETMIMLMGSGNSPVLDPNPFNGFRTLAANLAVELPEAAYLSTHFRVLFFSALVLFAMTFVLNTAAEVVRSRFRRRAGQL